MNGQVNPYPPYPIKHLILSFPGVLYDDVQVAFSITNKVLRLHELDTISFDEFREVAEGTLDEFIIPNFMPGYDREALRAELVKATKGEPRGRLCEGVLESLAELQRMGVSTSIVTSKGEDFVQSELKRLGLAGFFPDFGRFLAAREWSTVFNPGNISRTKAHAIMHILSENELPVGQCGYVGHMEKDIEEAKKVGVWTIAVDWPMSYNGGGRLSRARPDLIVRHVREIPAHIHVPAVTS